MSSHQVKQEAGVPRLRADLEYVPVSYQGRNSLLIRDPLGLSPQPVLVQGDALILLGLIDGRRTLGELQADLMRRRSGLFISEAEVAKWVADLETVGVLESPRLEEQRRRLAGEFTALPVRPAYLAGRSYPADRKALEDLLDVIMKSEEGSLPGRDEGEVRALVAPHIDLEAGRRAYARAYGALRGLPPPRRVVLLGTGHSLNSSFFSLSGKDFETPLGRVRSDRTAVRRLIERAGALAAPDDLGHRTEHSLEFQLIFLQRLFGSEFTVIPILVGSFQDDLSRRRRAADIPGVGALLRVLADAVEESDPPALIVAGVDLSHIGPKFGHGQSAASLLAETRRHDLRVIEALRRNDAAALWEEIRATEDRFNVCGFSTLACLLEILPQGRLNGRLLDYDVRREEATRSAVSFASLVYLAGAPSAKRESGI